MLRLRPPVRLRFPNATAIFVSVVPGTLTTASCSGLPVRRDPAILSRMGTKSRETIYGASVRAAAEVIAVRSRL